MYSRAEAAAIKQQFWTALGQYLSLHTSAEGEKINWVNYKTGIKGLYFRMDAGRSSASIAIEIFANDPQLRFQIYERLLQVKAILEAELSESWIWEPEFKDEHGKPGSRIYTELQEVNIFNRETWPTIISFLKPRILALDRFWCDAKYGFEDLQ